MLDYDVYERLLYGTLCLFPTLPNIKSNYFANITPSQRHSISELIPIKDEFTDLRGEFVNSSLSVRFIPDVSHGDFAIKFYMFAQGHLV
jgi:hypothetical protein